LARFRSFVIIIIVVVVVGVVVVGVVVVGLARRQRSDHCSVLGDPHDPRAPKKRQLGSLRCVSAGITALSLCWPPLDLALPPSKNAILLD
jgi:hypothetical protein